MSDHPSGCLAIWVDINEADETDYVHWLTRDHMPERIAVPGILTARYYRSVTATRRHFMIIYETEHDGVLSSAPYIERLNNPTEWTRRIMPKLQNVVRGVVSLTASDGVAGIGGIATAMRVDSDVPDLLDTDKAADIVARASKCERISRVSAYAIDAGATSLMTNEKKMRAGADHAFRHFGMVQGADERATAQAMQQLTAAINGTNGVFLHSYYLAHSLDQRVPAESTTPSVGAGHVPA
jgi:hypothetical protein